MSTARGSAQQGIIDVLTSRPPATSEEVATTAGLGRSTVGKALAALERAGRVRREVGGRQGGRRLPDRWYLAAEDDRERPRRDGGRLRPGQLDELVLDHLREHRADGPLTPTAVAKGLGRSSGAVGNCLARLAGTGRVSQVGKRPRRYALR